MKVNCVVGCRGDKWEVLRLREHTLRKRIKAAVDEKLNAVNGERIQRGIAATVALVGYTNTGKSSLIRRYSLMTYLGAANYADEIGFKLNSIGSFYYYYCYYSCNVCFTVAQGESEVGVESWYD